MDLNENITRKVRRGISISQGNEQLVSEARNKILDIIEEKTQDKSIYFKDAINNTFLLPNLCNYQFKFRAYLENDLIEQSALMHLEQCDRLNWWFVSDCMQRLWPLATTGDGNCLLHAASLAMWGFHDRHLTLRHALHHQMIYDNSTFYRRWLYQSVNDQKQQGFTLTNKEFEEEWSEICNLSFPSPKGSRTPFDLSSKEHNEKYLSCCSQPDSENGNVNEKCPISSVSPSKRCPSKKSKTLPPLTVNSKDNYFDFLEQIHVFVLSQVLRRPIIIISDTYVRDADGQPIQPLMFGGVYLPLLEKPEDCEKSPILLTYSYSHFSALVPMNLEHPEESNKQLPMGIPLIDPLSFELLPIHFAIDPGNSWVNSNFSPLTKKPHYKTLLKTYLHCDEFKFCPHHKRRNHQTNIIREDSTDSLAEHQKHSLTRTIGKHIKEKFSHKSKTKPTSCGDEVVQSQQHSINWEKFAEHDSVFGAKLTINVTSNYSDMIENYLKNAQADFDVLQKKSRRASIEFMSKIHADKENNQICKTPNCDKPVPLENLTCKLCSNCYDRESTTKVTKKQCMEPNCTALPTIENYCLQCYNKFTICRTRNCSSKSVTNGLCTQCASSTLTKNVSQMKKEVV